MTARTPAGTPPPAARITILDILRALALLGIVIVHTHDHFNLYLPMPPAEGWQAAANSAADWAYEHLFVSKSFLLFSFLFGLSFFIQLDRREQQGIDFRKRFMWRLTLLFLLGLAHTLFYDGDILTLFGTLGFALVMLYKCGTPLLIALCALPVVQRLARWLLHFLPDTGRWAERRESWLKQLDTLSTESRHLLADKPRCAAILGVHLVKLFLLFCLPWMGLRFMGLDTGLAFWQVQLLTSLTLFVSNALPNVAGMGSVETAFLLVYSSFLPDASSMSLLMFYRLASYYAVFAASAVGFALAQRRLNRG